MPSTLNISLEEEQKTWLNSRRESGGFSSFSDVVRSLIREAQEREREKLFKAFSELSANSGFSVEPEPEEEILGIIREVRKEQRARRP
jgi:Arc/MetJ-type ribon-helix-helix transcriptional regulator